MTSPMGIYVLRAFSQKLAKCDTHPTRVAPEICVMAVTRLSIKKCSSVIAPSKSRWHFPSASEIDGSIGFGWGKVA